MVGGCGAVAWGRGEVAGRGCAVRSGLMRCGTQRAEAVGTQRAEAVGTWGAEAVRCAEGY